MKKSFSAPYNRNFFIMTKRQKNLKYLRISCYAFERFNYLSLVTFAINPERVRENQPSPGEARKSTFASPNLGRGLKSVPIKYILLRF